MLIDQYWLGGSPNNWHTANIWVFNTFMAHCQFNQFYAENFPHLSFSHSILQIDNIYKWDWAVQNGSFSKWCDENCQNTRRKRFEMANKRYQPKEKTLANETIRCWTFNWINYHFFAMIFSWFSSIFFFHRQFWFTFYFIPWNAIV